MAMAELQIPGDQECPPHAAAVDRGLVNLDAEFCRLSPGIRNKGNADTEIGIRDSVHTVNHAKTVFRTIYASTCMLNIAC